MIGKYRYKHSKDYLIYTLIIVVIIILWRWIRN
jgi:hypothetical protein